MTLKLKRFNEGVWFDYPAGGRFKIRPLGPKDYLTIREASRKGKIAVFKGSSQFEIVDDYDEAKFFWATFSYMLQAWEGIEVDGASTDDEIREAIFNDKDIRDFITDKANEIFLNAQQSMEEESKNSKRSQDG